MENDMKQVTCTQNYINGEMQNARIGAICLSRSDAARLTREVRFVSRTTEMEDVFGDLCYSRVVEVLFADDVYAAEQKWHRDIAALTTGGAADCAGER